MNEKQVTLEQATQASVKQAQMAADHNVRYGNTNQDASAVVHVASQEDQNPYDIVKSQLQRIAAIKTELESIKPLYDELDTLVIAVSRANALGLIDTTVRLNDTVFTLVDNFESKNTVFRPVGVKRFELTVETAEEHAETLAKAAKKAAKAAK